METDVTCEAGTPSCVLAETADVFANCVTSGVPLPLSVARFQLIFRSLAPSAKPVIASCTCAGAVGEVKLPLASNVSDPVATELGVPAVPEVRSAPGMSFSSFQL